MARLSFLLLILTSCALFKPEPVYVKATPPEAIYTCKPTQRPDFVRLEVKGQVYYALTEEEVVVFKRMVGQTEACLLGWRDWSQ